MSPLLKKCVNDLNSYEAVTSPSYFVQLKLKCWLKKSTHVDRIKAKIVRIKLYFERYKGKLVLRIYSMSVYLQRLQYQQVSSGT